MPEGIMAAAAVVSAGVSIQSAQEQKKQSRAAQARANYEEARSRRRVIAEQRVLQSQIAAQAETQGITGASSVSGAQSSVGQQAADTISFQQNIGAFNSQIARSQNRQSNWQALGAAANAAGGIASIYRKP